MTLSLSHSWGFEPIKCQRGVYLRCAVWRPNTTAALLVGDWKREIDRQRTRKRGKGGGGGVEKKGREKKKKKKRGGGGGGKIRKKTQQISTINKESSVYSAFKDL